MSGVEHRLTTLLPSVSLMSRQCGILNISQPYRPPQPVMGIVLLFQSQSQSQSYLMTNGQSASLSWCQATISARDQFFFLLEISFRQLQVCYFVAPSLTRGRVCNLLSLLVLANAVLLDSRPNSIVPILETPPTCRARSPHLYPQGTGWPRYTPRHWVPFPSPLTTHRATVEVFYPATTRVIYFFSYLLYIYIYIYIYEGCP
jgi:hypothetical protein